MKRKIIVIAVWSIFVLSGAFAQLFPQTVSLHGENEHAEKPVLHKEQLLNGDYQSAFEDYATESMKIRNLLIPLRNQITYSIFSSSPNTNIVIGKDKELYEEEYIDFETQIYAPLSSEEIRQLVEKLEFIKRGLGKKGKKLFIFVTPSKGEVYAENIPDKYLVMAPKEKADSSYKLFVDALEDTDICYYDSVPYVNKLKEEADFRVFPKTGTHWSGVTAQMCAKELADSMEEQLNINLPEIEVTYERCDHPVHPDADIYNLLNLISSPHEEYYEGHMIVTDDSKDDHTIFLRGGSFMGTSVNALLQNSFFTNSYYLENTNIFCTDELYSGYFDSYEQLEVKEMLDRSDILFLEVNEEAIFKMSFGFIDYLLDNNMLE